MTTLYGDLYKKYKSKYLDIKKKLFPKKNNVDFDKLKITSTSTYSMSQPAFAEKITEIISHFLKKLGKTPKESTISECCSNVGGDTISFATAFAHVNAVELGNKEYESLKNNVHQYRLEKNVSITNGDYLKVMDQLSQDVVYLDPPWGGPGYTKYQTVDLFLSSTNVVDVVHKLITDKHVIFVAMKVPNNYNIPRLADKIKDTSYQILTFDLYNKDNRAVFKLLIIIDSTVKNDLNPKISVK